MRSGFREAPLRPAAAGEGGAPRAGKTALEEAAAGAPALALFREEEVMLLSRERGEVPVTEVTGNSPGETRSGETGSPCSLPMGSPGGATTRLNWGAERGVR